MAESLLVRAQSAGGSSGAQLVIGPAISNVDVYARHPYQVSGTSMLMAAVQVYNGYQNSWAQTSADWFIVVVGDNDIELPVKLYYSGQSSIVSVAWATMTTTRLMITSASDTQCSLRGRVFCTA